MGSQSSLCSRFSNTSLHLLDSPNQGGTQGMSQLEWLEDLPPPLQSNISSSTFRERHQHQTKRLGIWEGESSNKHNHYPRMNIDFQRGLIFKEDPHIKAGARDEKEWIKCLGWPRRSARFIDGDLEEYWGSNHNSSFPTASQYPFWVPRGRSPLSAPTLAVQLSHPDSDCNGHHSSSWRDLGQGREQILLLQLFASIHFLKSSCQCFASKTARMKTPHPSVQS